MLCGSTAQLSSTRAIAFAFYRDEGVAPTTPRGGEAPPPPGGDVVYGASAYEFEVVEGGDLAITDIYLTRQLATGEAARKLGGRPHADYGPLLARLPLATAVEGSAGAHTPARAAKHAAAADAYNTAWSTGDVNAALPVLSPSFTSFSLLTGTVADGRAAFQETVESLHSRWEPHWHDAVAAPTPGNKAFVLWRASGLAAIDAESTGLPQHHAWTSTWGISLLLFSEDDDAIESALSFAPPLPGGRAALAAKE